MAHSEREGCAGTGWVTAGWLSRVLCCSLLLSACVGGPHPLPPNDRATTAPSGNAGSSHQVKGSDAGRPGIVDANQPTAGGAKAGTNAAMSSAAGAGGSFSSGAAGARAGSGSQPTAGCGADAGVLACDDSDGGTLQH